MKIDELISVLQGIKDKHGNIEALLADRYMHYQIKYIDFSDPGSIEPHVCIRMKDNDKYYDIPMGNA